MLGVEDFLAPPLLSEHGLVCNEADWTIDRKKIPMYLLIILNNAFIHSIIK